MANTIDESAAGDRGVRDNDRFELLIFSEAGKPIYSYTKREDAVTLMPLCSALINYAKKAQKETLQSIRTSDNLIIHFTTRSPLIIIVIHEANSYVDHLVLVDQVEAQIISILTAKTLNSLFEDRPTFDLKRLLYGSEKLIDATTNLCAFPKEINSPWVETFLAVNQTGRPYRVLVPLAIIPSSTRDSIHNILQNVIANSSKNMVFSLLFRIEPHEGIKIDSDSTNGSESEDSSMATTTSDIRNDDEHDEKREPNGGAVDFKLITVCNHHERHKIKIPDIHIVLALLTGSRAQLDSVESLWMPICLPKFNKDAFVHSYIAYINDSKYCIVLMSIDRDEFANCQKAKNMIEERLDSLKSKLHYRPSPLINPTPVSLLDKHARQLQFLWYQTGKHVLWWQRSSKKSMNLVIYYVTKKMLQSSLKHLWLKLADNTIILGWHVPTYQLYAQFDCTISTDEATEVIQRITKWINKEEDNFIIKDYR
uniref:Vacuolar fusion protein MON1 homolog n=1 Tax=Aceria tosichella TaxID=561515 RepID=A0A6G1SB75_9ACAR